MAPTSTLVLGSIPDLESLGTCSPYLMPFHIDYSGKAPISTYLRVNAANETVGAPPLPENSTNDKPSTIDASEAGPSNSREEAVAAAAEDTTDTDAKPTSAAAPSTLKKRVTEATTRFISTFRGRTIQGLKVPLPEGYVGVVLRADGATSGKSQGEKDRAKAKAAETKRKVNRTGKGKARAVRGLIMRNKKHADADQGKEEELEHGDDDDPMDVDDDGLMNGGNQELFDEETTRTLAISSQFSSFILWHADHPVDENRDDYVRSLTEWTRLAHEIHRVED